MSDLQAPHRRSTATAGRVTRIAWVWGPVVIIMAAIFWASSLEDLPDVAEGFSDKTAHFWAYFALGASALRAFARARWERVTPRASAAAWGLAVVYGLTDEWHQSFVPERTPAVDDLVADAAGAAVAVLAGSWLARVLRRRHRTV